MHNQNFWFVLLVNKTNRLSYWVSFQFLTKRSIYLLILRKFLDILGELYGSTVIICNDKEEVNTVFNALRDVAIFAAKVLDPESPAEKGKIFFCFKINCNY